MEALIAGIVGIVVGGGISFAGNYFLNVQRYKQDTSKQDSDHNHNLVKQESEHKYERQTFLRQKYEELVFRLIDFSMILKSLEFTLQQEGNGASINMSDFIEKGGQIEVIAVLYFPKLVSECKSFLDISNQLFTAEYFHNSNPSDHNIDNLETLKTRFDKSYDRLYSKIQNHISDYT